MNVTGYIADFVRRALLDFYDESARPLPWRETSDPYAIWISEVMSQQTRIETMLPYYERWIERFPDVDSLAAADLDDVLKQWEGLGYYSRARNLHSAARIVRERYASSIPTSYESLRALPGIGDYTAGAVSSIAGGERRPAVDGNVRRVLARLFDLPRPSAGQLNALAVQLVPDERPGDFNQALMELGATICTPRAPSCSRCPVASDCLAFRTGTQLERPLPAPKKPIPTIDIATAVLVDPMQRLLLVRREGSLLRGLWSFPGEPVTDAADATDVAVAIAARYASQIGGVRPLATVEHTFSHRRERYISFLVDAVPGEAAQDVVWMDGEVRNLALPRAQQKIRGYALAQLG